MTVQREQIPALIAELRSAAGDGTDWTEDLFQRAADTLTHLTSANRTPVAYAMYGKASGELIGVQDARVLNREHVYLEPRPLYLD